MEEFGTAIKEAYLRTVTRWWFLPAFAASLGFAVLEFFDPSLQWIAAVLAALILGYFFYRLWYEYVLAQTSVQRTVEVAEQKPERVEGGSGSSFS